MVSTVGSSSVAVAKDSSLPAGAPSLKALMLEMYTYCFTRGQSSVAEAPTMRGK
jgi:hypothetical protein